MASNHLSELSPLMTSKMKLGHYQCLSHFLTLVDKPHQILFLEHNFSILDS